MSSVAYKESSNLEKREEIIKRQTESLISGALMALEKDRQEGRFS